MTTPTRKRASRKAVVPPAQFQPAEPEEPPAAKLRVVPNAETVQMPPGFKNGQRVHETIPDRPEDPCVDRSGCNEAAVVQVVGRRHIRYCARHGAEFEVRQDAVVVGRFELEPVNQKA